MIENIKITWTGELTKARMDWICRKIEELYTRIQENRNRLALTDLSDNHRVEALCSRIRMDEHRARNCKALIGE